MSTPVLPPPTARITWIASSLGANAIRTTGALTALTALTAALVAVAPGLAGHVNDVVSVRLDAANIAHTPGEVARILLNNLLVVAALVAAAVARPRFARLGRCVCDVVAVTIVARSGLVVGAVLGANGSALLPYLVHLPLEWLAVGVAAGAWLLSLRRPLSVPDALHAGALVLALLLAAAALETYATPR